MAISASDPITPAMNRVGQMVFKPFSATKWFAIGFAAWLSTLGEGCSGNFQLPSGGGGGGGAPPGGRTGTGGGTSNVNIHVHDVAVPWVDLVRVHLWWIIPAAFAALVLYVVVLWVRARAKFIFLESVAYNRAAIVEPWKRLRPLGNSFFRFSLLLVILGMAAAVIVISAVALLGLPDLRAGIWSGAVIAAVIIGILFIIGISLIFAVVSTVTEDFVLPIMYLRGSMVGPAWREFRQAIVPGNVGALVVFFLLRIVLGIGAGMIMMLGMCLTCFLAALPYVSGVVFLPIFIFNRAYPLYFLRQFGPQYDLLVEIVPSPVSAFQVVMPASYEQVPQQPPPPPPPPGDSV